MFRGETYFCSFLVPEMSFARASSLDDVAAEEVIELEDLAVEVVQAVDVSEEEMKPGVVNRPRKSSRATRRPDRYSP